MQTFSGILSTEIPQHWSEVAPLIEKALTYNPVYTLDDIYWNLVQRSMQLWTEVTDGKVTSVAITSVDKTLKSHICTILLAAGKLTRRWEAHLAYIEVWAKHLGCDQIEIIGRPGWQRWHKGFELAYVAIRKPL